MKRPAKWYSRQGLLLVEAVLSAVIMAAVLVFISRGLGGQLRALRTLQDYDALCALAESTLERWEAERTIVQFTSSLGPAAAKIKKWMGEVVHIAPEYESCKALAVSSGLPLAEVYRRLEQEARAHILT